MSDDYYVTLPIHSHAEVTKVILIMSESDVMFLGRGVQPRSIAKSSGNNQIDPWPTVAYVKLCMINTR